MNRILTHRRHRAPLARVVCTLAAAALFAGAVATPAFAAGAEKPAQVIVNVNTASAEELVQLPGIGEARARAIVAERSERGGFASVDELIDVKGIGESLLAKLRPYVRVDGPSGARPASE